MTPSKPPSGRTIVLELQREMEARLYPLMYRTLRPARLSTSIFIRTTTARFEPIVAAHCR